MDKRHSIIICSIITVLLISGCPNDINKPVTTPTPVNFVTPTPIVSDIPEIPGSLTSDLFKIQFGPSTKGTTSFGPATKGVNNDFGPSTKGVSNLRFNINFDANLTHSDITPFSTKSETSVQELKLSDVKLSLQKKGNLIANIDVLPKDNQLVFGLDTNIEPGEYDLIATVTNNFEPLTYATLINLESNLEIKVVLYAKELKREDLDIAIRTKPIVESSITK